jgi:hypothetical protein
MTAPRIADTGAGGLGAPEMAAELARFLEPDAPLIPWWRFPGAVAWLKQQRVLTPTRVEALEALAGRSDDVTLAEVGRRFAMRPKDLQRWQSVANRLVQQRFLARVMEGVAMPMRRQTVQTLRERRALSLDDLAERAGVSVGTVFRAAHGLPIRPSNKRRLAAVLGAQPDQIKWEQAG